MSLSRGQESPESGANCPGDLWKKNSQVRETKDGYRRERAGKSRTAHASRLPRPHGELPVFSGKPANRLRDAISTFFNPRQLFSMFFNFEIQPYSTLFNHSQRVSMVSTGLKISGPVRTIAPSFAWGRLTREAGCRESENRGCKPLPQDTGLSSKPQEVRSSSRLCAFAWEKIHAHLRSQSIAAGRRSRSNTAKENLFLRGLTST